MGKKNVFILLLVSICIMASPINAQKNVDTQHLLWLRYYVKLRINDTYQIKQEVEERVYWFPWRQNQFLCRTLVERRLTKNWSTALGFTYSVQSLPNDPQTIISSRITELRPQLEITYNQSLSSKFSLNHRYWTEFRFFEQSNGIFDYTNNRTRYKLELIYMPSSKITLKAFDEILLNIGSKVVHNVFDQNRYGASVQYLPAKHFGLELGYLNWFQQRLSGIDFYNRHIVRLTIHHSLNLKNTKS